MNLKVGQPKLARRRSKNNKGVKIHSDLWPNIELSDIRAIRVAEGEGRETAKIFEEMVSESFKI